jgi:hypothetical protein
MIAVAKRRRKCLACGEWYQPWTTLQKACSTPCALRVAKMADDKRRKRELREAKERIKTRSEWMKEAQPAFNAFIRERDKDEPCISCGVTNPPERFGGAWDCGHYLTVGAHPELRFEEKNAHKQCKSCNGGSGRFSHKAKTVNAQYRERLVERIGEGSVEWLEGPHEPKNYTIEDIKEIRDLYRWKLRELRKANG